MSDPESQFDYPLIAAARDGRIATVRALVEGGAPLDSIGPASGTAICWAAARGHAHVVDLLLTAGANRHLGGGPGGWAYRSNGGIQWDVLAVTRADPELTTLWRSGGLPIERRDNYTMTEMTTRSVGSLYAKAIGSGEDCAKTDCLTVVRNGLEAIDLTGIGPVVAVYTRFTAGFSSYNEDGQTCSVEVVALNESGDRDLKPVRCGRVMVKGPLTQLGFAHYSLRLAIEQLGLPDPAREIREIYHYYEAPESDGNITELQIALI